MSFSTVFGGGVHGVGKTSLFAKVATSLGVTHWSASDLIRAEKSGAVQENSKVANDIEGNQNLLVRGFRRASAVASGKILLDGHFTLLNALGEIEDVPQSTFSKLELSALICMTDDPALIRRRLLARDGRAPDEAAIANHQIRELSRARQLAFALKIPWCEIKSQDSILLSSFLSSYGALP